MNKKKNSKTQKNKRNCNKRNINVDKISTLYSKISVDEEDTGEKSKHMKFEYMMYIIISENNLHAISRL